MSWNTLIYKDEWDVHTELNAGFSPPATELKSVQKRQHPISTHKGNICRNYHKCRGSIFCLSQVLQICWTDEWPSLATLNTLEWVHHHLLHLQMFVHCQQKPRPIWPLDWNATVWRPEGNSSLCCGHCQCSLCICWSDCWWGMKCDQSSPQVSSKWFQGQSCIEIKTNIKKRD